MEFKKCQYIISDNKSYVLNKRSGELEQVLVDCSASGKRNSFHTIKQENLYLSQVYKYIANESFKNQSEFEKGSFLDLPCDTNYMIKRRKKLYFCSRYFEFAHLKDNTKHISYLESCHSSLCPMCNFFRARSDLRQLIQVFDEFYKNPIYANCPLLFVTLTVPNCYSEDLQTTLDLLSSSFNKFTKSKEYQATFLGCSRSLEITYNNKSCTAHPHLHLLLVARPDYFKNSPCLSEDKTRKNKGRGETFNVGSVGSEAVNTFNVGSRGGTCSPYISKDYLLYLWQRCCGVHRFRKYNKWLPWYKSMFYPVPDGDQLRLASYAPSNFITQVDIRRVRVPSDQKLRQQLQTTGCTKLVLKALSEVIKYPFKPEQLLTGDIKKDAERVFFLDRAMFHRRRWQLSGCLKDIARSLDLPEDEQSELVECVGLDPDQIDYYSGWWYNGVFGEYIRGRLKTVSEKNKIRKFLGLPVVGCVQDD